MHILQLVPALTVGGVERGVVDVTKGLLARGHRVTVVSSGGPLVDVLTRLGAAHHAWPVHEKSPFTVRACIPRVADLIRATEVDVVHARSRVPAWIGYVAARRTQRPFVTTAHGFYRPHVTSRVMVWGRLVIAPSEALGRYLMEAFGLPKARLRVIPRGVDLEEFACQPMPPREGPWRIGLFGRLSPIKGHAVALQAVAQLLRRGVPVRLSLTGNQEGSPDRRSLEDLARRLGVADAVEWLGVRQDVPALIASTEAVIVPSIYPESFGRGVIEAQAVGRPVVASRIGALGELIEDGQTGLLVGPGDPQALADALERLFSDDALRARCVAAGRRRVEEMWSVSRMVDATAAVYEECRLRPRILVWKLSAVGDIVLSTPTIRAVRRQFPEAHLAAAVGRAGYELLARCPYLNDVLILDRRGPGGGWRRHWTFLRRLRREAFDISIDLQNTRATHALAWLAGVTVRVGYRRKWGGLLNRGVRLPRVVLAPVAHQHHLLREAGFTPGDEQLEVWPSPLDDETARRLLAPADGRQRVVVGVHPGGSRRWQTKRWDLSRWAQVCSILGRQDRLVVVIGGPEERALGETLAQLADPPPLSIIGQTSLMELACVIRRCAVFLAHDSSSLHLAAAVGTPAVALFGPTDPARHLPPAFAGRVLTQPVFCSPCYAPRCRTLTHACMKRITVDEVLRATLTLLADAERHAP